MAKKTSLYLVWKPSLSALATNFIHFIIFDVDVLILAESKGRESNGVCLTVVSVPLTRCGGPNEQGYPLRSAASIRVHFTEPTGIYGPDSSRCHGQKKDRIYVYGYMGMFEKFNDSWN